MCYTIELFYTKLIEELILESIHYLLNKITTMFFYVNNAKCAMEIVYLIRMLLHEIFIKLMYIMQFIHTHTSIRLFNFTKC